MSVLCLSHRLRQQKQLSSEEYFLASLVLFPNLNPDMSQLMIDTIKGKLHCIAPWLPVLVDLLERACRALHQTARWANDVVPGYDKMSEVQQDKAKANTDFWNPIVFKFLSHFLSVVGHPPHWITGAA